MGEIYKVTNNISGKIYIGKTKRKTRDRWLEHVRDAKNYPLKNIPLHKAIIKYGAENFQIETIETNVPEEELNYKEKYYIKKFNSTNSSIGYNATIGGDGGMVSSKLSEKDVNEIKLILSDKENIDSINKIAKQFNVTNTTIRAINDGKAWFDDSLSYPIRKYNTKTLGIERKIYEKIVNDLLNSNLQIYEIAKIIMLILHVYIILIMEEIVTMVKTIIIKIFILIIFQLEKLIIKLSVILTKHFMKYYLQTNLYHK